MSWFEAYILWKLDTWHDFACVVAFFLTAAAVILTTSYLVPWKSTKPKRYGILVFIAWFTSLIVLSCSLLIPTTDTAIKIIATKGGVDAIRSETAGKYLSEADKTVTNGMKLLNQEIEKKLDKKEVSK